MEFAHKMFLIFLYKFLGLVHIDLDIQLFIKKCRLYIYLVNLPIHDGSNCKYTSNDDELGNRGTILIEAYSDNLKISIYYRNYFVDDNLAQYIHLGA